MADAAREWDEAEVRKWLESRVQSARLDQSVADREGYQANDDYDKATAEEWVCRILSMGARINSQTSLAGRIKALLAQDEYRVTGIHDDARFERHVRAALRKVAKMAKANKGFGNTSRYQ